MHHALRMPKGCSFNVEGTNAAVHAVLDRVRTFTERVRSGEHLGATGKKLTNVVAIGIGGKLRRREEGDGWWLCPRLFHPLTLRFVPCSIIRVHSNAACCSPCPTNANIAQNEFHGIKKEAS